MSLDSLREGTCKGCPYYWPKYCLTVVLEKNSSKTPKSKAEVFQLAHERNIKKMQGYDAGAYDKEYLGLYSKFGIDALTVFNQDLQPWRMKPLIRWWRFLQSIVKILNMSFDPFEYMDDNMFYILKDKQFASESLLNQTNLYDFCEYDGLLLQQEAQKWEEARNLYLEFKTLYYNNETVENMVPKLEEIVHVIDEIKNIQENILKGPGNGGNSNLQVSITQITYQSNQQSSPASSPQNSPSSQPGSQPGNT